MSVEKLKAEIADLNTQNDRFYNGLAPILNEWLTLTQQINQATTGTSQDVSAVHAALKDGDDAIHLIADASIRLGQTLTAFAATL
ncbi:hypothetical protein [Amycolatopsis sp. NPDC059657]|uniref:hypothetical protein n=1 Tax=Amycolatopsis sp. NPDC059657 TaxID=3346899 RepID=UPI00366CA075